MPMYGPMSAYGTTGINPAANPPAEPFVWGAGGGRLSMDDLTQRRRMAMANLAGGADYSPVGHWTQGLARASQGILGGLQVRNADKLANERADAQQSIIEALMSGPVEGGPDPVAAALANPELRDIGLAMWKARQPKPVEPSIQRRNDGSIIGLNPMTGDIMFEQADPNPKPALDWISVKNDDGTTTLVPVGAGGPILQGGGGPASGAVPGASPAMPPDTLPPDFDFGDGGPGGSPSGARFPGR